MELEHTVMFRGDSARDLGIDDDRGRSAVCPAIEVLKRIEYPRGNPEEFVTSWQIHLYHEASEFLQRLGSLMVRVYPMGIVVGEFRVEPLFVTEDMYARMRRVP